jgi:hypothetical protein
VCPGKTERGVENDSRTLGSHFLYRYWKMDIYGRGTNERGTDTFVWGAVG